MKKKHWLQRTPVVATIALFVFSLAVTSYALGKLDYFKFSSLNPSSQAIAGAAYGLVLSNPQVKCVNGTNQISIIWSAIRNSDTYVVQRKAANSNNWQTISPVLNNSTLSFTDFSQNSSQVTYNYRLVANYRHAKILSNTVQVTVNVCQLTTPTPPVVTPPVVTPPVVTPPVVTPPVTTSPVVTPPVVTPPVVTPPVVTPPVVTPPVVTPPVVTPPVVIPPVVTPPVVTPPTTPVKKLWGAYLGYQTTDAATFESLVGAKMNLQALFIHWGNENAFPTQFGPTVRDQNKTLVIFWESDDYNLDVSQETAYTYSKILAGNFDSYIKQFAADAKSYGGPVILVPFDEMNGNWSAWSGTLNGNSASQEIAAYRYLRNFFTADTNVKFAWDVNNDSVPDISGNQISDYYPGDQYVDYLGVDGFNFDSPWQTWSSVFSSSLNTLKAYPKPIYIFSTASSQGTQKAAWITQGLGTDIYNYPQVAGWVWFNENKERDWRVNSDAASLKAFQQIVQ